MYRTSKFDEARVVIRQGISEGIDFQELRNRLPDWRKRPLQSVIFDVMGELGLQNVPFPGMLVRPRLSRKPIPVSEAGDLNIRELLAEKGFLGANCVARAHVGKTKITLTVKPVKANAKMEEYQ